MKIFSKLIFKVLAYVVFNFSTPYATDVVENGEDEVHAQQQRAQFNPKSIQEYIKQEKKRSHTPYL